jgi:flagellar M-ring protein FliF
MADYLKKILDSWKGINRVQQIMVIAVVSLAVIVIAVVVSMYSQDEYEVLYANLSQDDAAAVYTELEAQQIDVQATGDGTTILVPKGQAENLKLTLAAQGIPASNAISYEFYTENAGSFGTTERDKAQIGTYQQQITLSQTINQMAKVKSSIVLLNVRQESAFVLSDNDDAVSTASVQIQPEQGQTFTEADAATVRELVAAAVSSLAPENVVVVNSETMQMYNSSSNTTGTGLVAEQLELQNRMSMNVQQQMINLLSPVFGPDRLSASCNVVLDFDDYRSETLTLTPVTDVGEEGNMGIAVSLKRTAERVAGGEAAEGEPGMDPNGGAPIYQMTDEELMDSDYYRVTEEANYEVNEMLEELERAQGGIKEFSATLIIDGGEDLEDILPEVRAQLTTALGAPADSITVSAMPFEYNARIREEWETAQAEIEAERRSAMMQ